MLLKRIGFIAGSDEAESAGGDPIDSSGVQFPTGGYPLQPIIIGVINGDYLRDIVLLLKNQWPRNPRKTRNINREHLIYSSLQGTQ